MSIEFVITRSVTYPGSYQDSFFVLYIKEDPLLELLLVSPQEMITKSGRRAEDSYYNAFWSIPSKSNSKK